MAEIHPFRALRYAPRLRAELARLLTPPYDVISPKMQEELYARHPNNLVRLDLGRKSADDTETDNRYTRAAKTLAEWREAGVLVREQTPSYYVYEQEFDLPGRGRTRRRGFFCSVRLEAPEAGGIRLHENTFAGPKADRLALTHATACNLSPIFSVYDDAAREIDGLLARAGESGEPDVAELEGIVHRMWTIDDKEQTAAIGRAMADKPLYVADGHHRYETRLAYQSERREQTGRREGDEPFDFALMFLANMHAEGVQILPTHRALLNGAGDRAGELLDKLAEKFDLTKTDLESDAANAASALAETLAKAGEAGPAFIVLTAGGQAHLARLKSGVDATALVAEENLAQEVKRLDATILHRYIIARLWLAPGAPEPGHDDIGYVKDGAELVTMAREGRCAAAFMMNPTKMEQVQAIATLGERMPQKSTYFYPKIITGMVIREMGDEN